MSVRFLVALTLAALATRLVWVLVVHPPTDYVYSDMKRYVARAQELVTQGFQPGNRSLAWQAWGTHYVLAVPLWLLGPDRLGAASVLWGLMAASAPPLAYLLACRVCRRRATAYAVGVATLLWHPNLSNSGYFLSETPFLCFQLWSTYACVVALQTGKRSLEAGLVSAVAFAIRPQAAIFFALLGVLWFVDRKVLPNVRIRQLLSMSIPLLAMLAFSMWRFHAHTGYWGGIAENANMNLTAGRCHNIATQAFRTPAQLQRSERTGNTRDGRRVSLPGFRLLGRDLPSGHPLALRPAMKSPTLRFVGYIGDPEVHRELRRQCYRATGWVEQIRYSVVNASLLWFVGRQWPEMERGKRTFLPYVEFYKYLFQWVVWIPSLLGVVLGLANLRARPALCVVALQLTTSIGVASTFFGSIRLRTPYDPYSLLLAAEVLTLAVLWLDTYRPARRADT